MRNFSKVGGVIAGGALLLTVGLSPATADDLGGAAISGGSLSKVTSGATMSSLTLDGTNTQTSTGTSSEWILIDPRGTGAAWTLSVTASDFTSDPGILESTPRTIAIGNLTISPGTVTAGAGSDPTNNISAPDLVMDGSEQALVASSGTNKGTYTLTPSFSLNIPANAFRSNYAVLIGEGTLKPYAATVTYTLG
jgi:hypothetical protein